MAVVHVKHHPELTAEKAMEIFKKGFAGKYEVYKWPSPAAEGFHCKEEQPDRGRSEAEAGERQDHFIYADIIPSALMALLFASFGMRYSIAPSIRRW